MTRKSLTVISVLISIFMFYACASSDNSTPVPPPPPGVSIYLAGSAINADRIIGVSPVFWKDGAITQLISAVGENDDGGKGRSIFVDGDDVYVSGEFFVPCSDDPNVICAQPAYWKNGVRTDLPVSGVGGYAFSMIVSNGNVYIAGLDWLEPVLWINGVKTVLPVLEGARGGTAYKIVKDGEDLYIGGSSWINRDEGHRPAYWKNGSLVSIPVDEGQEACVMSIDVENGTVYTGGWLSESVGSKVLPVYWVGEEERLLADPAGTALGIVEAIEASSGFVAAGGFYEADGESPYKPAIWINGERQILSQKDPGSSGIVKDVKYSNGNLYISGGTDYTDGSETRRTACYWINGLRTDLAGLAFLSDLSYEDFDMSIPDTMVQGELELDDPDIAMGIFIK
jgi:hypothetical protein